MGHDTETKPDRWLTREHLRSRYEIGTANIKLRRWERQRRFPRRVTQPDVTDQWSEREI